MSGIGTGVDFAIPNIAKDLFKTTVDAADINNPRNDQSSIIKLDNGRLLIAYSRFSDDPLDSSPSAIYAAYSMDEGKSWEEPFELQPNITDTIGTYIPSFFRKSNGNILMFFFVRILPVPTPESQLWVIEYDQDLNIITPAADIGLATGYYPIAPDRLFYDEVSDLLLMPYQKLISGNGNSPTSVYESRLLTSDNEGATWTDSGLSIGSDLLLYNTYGGATEPGIFKTPQGKLIYYFRTLVGGVYAAEMTYSGDYSFGSYYKLYDAGNAQSCIKLWEEKNLLIAASTRGNEYDAFTRKHIDILTSTDGLSWSKTYELDSTVDSYTINEPTVYIDNNNNYVLFAYSKTVSSTSYYDILTKRFSADNFKYNYKPTFFNGLSDNGQGLIYNGIQRQIIDNPAGYVVKLRDPKQGQFKSISTESGAIKITLPNNSNTHISIRGTVFEQTTNKCFTFNISCNFFASIFTARIEGSDNSVNYTVRFVNDTKPKIYIGELASSWNRLHVTIDEISASHAANLELLSKDWEIGLETNSFGTVTATKTNNFIYGNLQQPLTGLTTASYASIDATDTHLTAFAKLQAQADAFKTIIVVNPDLDNLGGHNKTILATGTIANAPTTGNLFVLTIENTTLTGTKKQLVFSQNTNEIYHRRGVGYPWVKLANSDDLLIKADLVAGKVPASQLPSYVDDVLEYPDLGSFPVTGETGKIYVATDTNKTYRWTGTVYVEISPSNVTIINASATLDFPSTAVGAKSDLLLSVPGAEMSDTVVLGIPHPSIQNAGVFVAWVDKPDSVTIRFMHNDPVNPVDPPSGLFKIKIIKD